MINQREIALLALYDIEFKNTYSNLALKNILTKDMTGKEKAFITELVYGVTRWKLTLDYIISKFSKVKLKKLSKFTLLILRLGVFQIYFLNKVPESAAVNESVKLANKYAAKSKGFINGVLHSVIREKENIEFPKEKMDFLSVKYSFPKEIIADLIDVPNIENLLDSLNKEPRTTIRINTLKCDSLEIANAEDSKLYSFAKYVKGFDIANSKEYNDGKFIAQDIAAMMTSVALNPKPNDLCIDLCAAPGGKTTHLAELMGNKGKIFAFDIHPHKADIIRKNAKRMGIDIIEADTNDATVVMDELIGKADKVLADVPCSGLGIISRKPDIKWNKEDIKNLPKLQMKILENAAKYLKVGGELVYSTCTLLKRENEDIILAFVKNNPEFEFVKVELPEPLDRKNDGYITLYPHIDGTDGFFISKIKRCK